MPMSGYGACRRIAAAAIWLLLAVAIGAPAGAAERLSEREKAGFAQWLHSLERTVQAWHAAEAAPDGPLYPRGMPAARALKLALGALAGARELSAEQVRDRVVGRYPEAEPLPDRPALDALLEEVGSELRWQPGARGGAGAYVSPLREFTTVSTATTVARPTSIAAAFEEVPADRVEAEEFARQQPSFAALERSPANDISDRNPRLFSGR